MNWRAIGIGVAVGLGGSLVLGVLFRMLPWEAGERLWIFMALSYVAGGLVVHAGHVATFDQIAAFGRAIQAAEDIEQARLARTGRAGNGDEFARTDTQVDAGQCLHHLPVHGIAAAHATQLDQFARALVIRHPSPTACRLDSL